MVVSSILTDEPTEQWSNNFKLNNVTGFVPVNFYSVQINLNNSD